MYARIDFPATDIIESTEDATVRAFRYDSDDLTEQGIKIIIGSAVVDIYPVSELAQRIIEVTKDGDPQRTADSHPRISGSSTRP